jgi:LysW-gamma-L-lysine carboxypeptidase
VTVAYKGRLTLDVVVSREARHGAAPGPTVAEEALEVWERVRGSAGERAGAGRSFERLDCRLEGIDAGAGDGLVERARLRIGYRVPPGVDPGDLERAALRLATRDGDTSIVVTTQGREEPVRTPRTSPLARAFARAIAAAGGQTTFKEKSGTSDMNILFPAWRCPMVAYGPGDSRYDHTPIERLSIGDFARSITVLRGVLSRASDRII